MDLNLQNMLETPFPFFISRKAGEIPIFGTFLAKKSILAYISLKINIFRLAMFYYVILMSYVARFSGFWYQWKEETLPYTNGTKQLYFGHVNFKFTEGIVTNPLRKMCDKKGSGRRGINLVILEWPVFHLLKRSNSVIFSNYNFTVLLIPQQLENMCFWDTVN